MCGRFDQHTLPYRYAGYLQAIVRARDDDPPPRYNVAPQTQAWVARASGSGRELAPLLWGLVAYWVKDPKKAVKPINARAETLGARPMFRELIATRRCLVPVDGFYEWQATPTGKVPHYIRLADDAPMLLAGLWDRWRHGDAQPIESFTILTTTPNELVAKLHDRMPVIIDAAHAATWLEAPAGDVAAATALLRPYPAEQMRAYPVSLRVNAAQNDGPELIEPLPELSGRSAPFGACLGARHHARHRRRRGPLDLRDLDRLPGLGVASTEAATTLAFAHRLALVGLTVSGANPTRTATPCKPSR
jgi:putative SOS response-associated peptidase YedK